MKVIDLLNKIANGEEIPTKIKWCDVPFIYDKDKLDYVNNGYFSLFRHDDNSNLTKMLNDEVEIIEDIPKKNKKIEYFDDYKINARCFDELVKSINLYIELNANKINEIINKVNGR